MHPSFNFESSDYLKFISILQLNAWLIFQLRSYLESHCYNHYWKQTHT